MLEDLVGDGDSCAYHFDLWIIEFDVDDYRLDQLVEWELLLLGVCADYYLGIIWDPNCIFEGWIRDLFCLSLQIMRQGLLITEL